MCLFCEVSRKNCCGTHDAVRVLPHTYRKTIVYRNCSLPFNWSATYLQLHPNPYANGLCVKISTPSAYELACCVLFAIYSRHPRVYRNTCLLTSCSCACIFPKSSHPTVKDSMVCDVSPFSFIWIILRSTYLKIRQCSQYGLPRCAPLFTSSSLSLFTKYVLAYHVSAVLSGVQRSKKHTYLQ
jgi:hypothetical protein